MGRIREYSLDSNLPAAPQARLATADNSSGLVSLGNSMEALGGAVQKFGEAYQESYVKSAAKKAASQGELELQQYEMELMRGSIDQDGKRVPPPDPISHMDLYYKKVKEIQERAYGSLKDERASSLFDAEFSGAVNRGTLSVQKNRLEQFDQGIKENTIQFVNNKADAFVNADSPLSKAQIQDEVFGKLDGIEATRGAEERAKMQKLFTDQTARGSILKMIRLNPSDAFRSLEAGEFDKDLPADEIEEWKAKSINAQKSNREGTTDPSLFVDLRIAAGKGADIRGQVRSAIARGQLKPSDANTLLSEVEQNAPTVYQENWFKSGNNYLDVALKTDPADNPFKKNVDAQARQAWLNWSASHPKATPAEAQSEVARLVQDASLIRSEKIGANKLVPRYLKGEINDPDIGATVRETQKQFEEGKIDKYERDRQMSLIKQWEPVAEAARVSKQRAAPGKGK